VEGASVQLIAPAAAGVAAGLFLLWRGFAGYRTATRIGDIATSRISALAAGEVRITGEVEPAETLLTSMLQSVPCVYYRSTVKSRNDDSQRTIHDEERAVGFRIRDDSGEVRIFPRNAVWDVPPRFDDRSTSADGLPAGLRLRNGSPYQLASPDREAQIADLLTPDAPLDAGSPLYASGSNRQYVETRIEPGDRVTIVGRALPFGHLSDPSEADTAGGAVLHATDSEVAMDIAEAREAGILLGDPALAWGNAAIPGFGIGAPVRSPVLDPAASMPVLAPPEAAARISRTFDIAPEQLVVAAGADMPLLIAFGVPSAAAARHHDTFLVGLLGAVLAIGSAVVLAVALTSGGGG
jgi:hypothetical protein